VDVLAGNATLEEAIVRAQQMPNLYILPAGESRTNPAELIDSGVWPALCQELRERFEYIVLDSPPVDATPYYGRVEEVCDGVVVVVRPDHTHRSILSDALKRIPEQKLLGVVLNCTKKWFLLKDHRGYYGYAGRTEKERPGSMRPS
jgi:Mrp family chromosome partitioning ATPase